MTDSVHDQLQQEWESLLPSPGLPAAASIPQNKPGRFALYAALEEPLTILQDLHDSGLLEKFGKRFINTSWSVRDLVTHLASWAAELRNQVETLAENRGFDYAIPFGLSLIGPNEWNRTELEKRKARGVVEAVHEYETETRLTQDLVLDMPESVLYAAEEFPMAPSGDPAARWRGSIAMMVFAQARHFGYHLNQIRARLRMM